jgi:hypothetical protein
MGYLWSGKFEGDAARQSSPRCGISNIEQPFACYFKFEYVTRPDGKKLVESFSAKQIIDVDRFPKEFITFDIAPFSGGKRSYGLECGVLLDGIGRFGN